MTDSDEPTKVQQWYIDYLNSRGEYEKAAKYKVELFSIAASRKAIVEVNLDGDVSNIFNADTPKRVKDQWNDLGTRSIQLIEEAHEGFKTATDEYKKSAVELTEDQLPEFLREDTTITRKAMKLMSSGWYQDSVGELYHYDGVVWDKVPKAKIDDLEFLGG